MSNIFFEITIIICLVSVFTIILKLLRQPAILAYILTGIIIGPFGQLQLQNLDAIKTMGEFGITLLLFMMGLELNFKELKSIGKSVFIIGINQIILTGLAAYFISSIFNFPVLTSFYISIALTLSSTIIVVKLLSDKRELTSLYGKISIGLLLVQDFLAILVLIFLSGFNSESQSLDLSQLNLFSLFIKGVILFAVVAFLSEKVFPKLIHLIAKSQEALFLVSIAWVFGLAAVVSSPTVGFSIEIGGFLAGLSLANAMENFQIASKVRALRDFFITIFFVSLGMQMQLGSLEKIMLPVIVFSLFVLILKPLIITSAMGFLGYRKRTSFLTGIHAGQISEFSLIIIFLGNKLGQIPTEISSLITGVGVITFVFSTYAISNANRLFKILSPCLWFFERKQTKRENIGSTEEDLGKLKDHVVLIGANRIGESILDAIDGLKDKVVVVDFDPQIVEKLKNKKVITIFGDISDTDIQERLRLDKAKMIISTAPDTEDNLFLINCIKSLNKTAKIIVVSYDSDDAKYLYKAGADYVVLPHLAGGRHIAKILEENNLEEMKNLKPKD